MPHHHGAKDSQPADAERWQLDLPNDPVAAAEYLRSMERAKGIELAAIQRLRRRIEGDRSRFGLPRGVVAAILAAACVLAGIGVLLLDTSPEPDAATGGAAHAAHAAAGSGLAVSIFADGPKASRSTTTAGATTFVLRNEQSVEASVSVTPVGGDEGNAPMSPSIAAGDRIEWPLTLQAGRYEVHALVEGEPAGTAATITVT